MIPKKIHYIWLGKNPLPKMVKKCMKSWAKHCPDYEIVRWDESNLDLDSNQFCKEAYECKKYAFASDVLRFQILKEQGGIYLDVDVELYKPLDDLLEAKSFTGQEQGDHLWVAPGLILASISNGEVVSKMVDLYKKERFIMEDGSYNLETVGVKLTKLLVDNYKFEIGKNEVQDLDEMVVYPTEYFCPLNSASKELLYKTDKTYSIHHYLASWLPKPPLKTRLKMFVNKLGVKILGRKNAQKLKSIIKGKKNG